MRRALPRELQEDTMPVLTLDISERRFRELFPVRLTRSGSMAEPEPSKGALIALTNGSPIVVMYGLETRHATISVPVSASVTKVLDALFAEAPIAREEISWAAPAAAGAVRKLGGKSGKGMRVLRGLGLVPIRRGLAGFFTPPSPATPLPPSPPGARAGRATPPRIPPAPAKPPRRR